MQIEGTITIKGRTYDLVAHHVTGERWSVSAYSDNGGALMFPVIASGKEETLDNARRRLTTFIRRGEDF